MSYIVEVIRPIGKEEVVALVRTDNELSVLAEGENWADIAWFRGDEHAVLNLAQGRITVSTPGKGAWEKTQAIAQLLHAAVVGEEDDLPNRPEARPGVSGARSTWIGWPVLVFLLGAMLAWKW